MLFCHRHLSTSNLFQWEFHWLPFQCISQFQDFFFSRNLLLFCLKHIQDVFLVCFFYTFWTFLNPSLVVTTDTFNTWLPSQIIFEATVEFLPFFKFSQLCFFRHFHFTVKQEIYWPQKIMITKRSFLNFKRLQNKVFVFQQIIYSSTRGKCVSVESKIRLFLKLSEIRSSHLEVFSVLPQHLLEADSENCSSWHPKWKHKHVFTFSNLLSNANLGSSHLRDDSWK